jgi:transcriptional regulator with XRE-family HTH domain
MAIWSALHYLHIFMSNKYPNPDLFMTALSLAIQRRRQELRLSQDEVAQRSGLHRTYISELERHSRNFSVRSYLKLADALELKPSELMRVAEVLAQGTQPNGEPDPPAKEATK